MTKLDRCWKNRLRMYKWVADVFDGTVGVATLKGMWLRSHRFTRYISANCFFCQYASEHSESCSTCPGYLVASSFSCHHKMYDYRDKPKQFYAELLRLNNIRTNKSTT